MNSEITIINDFFNLFFSDLNVHIEITTNYKININIVNLANNILVLDGKTYLFYTFNNTISSVTIEEIVNVIFSYIPEFMCFMGIFCYSNGNLLYSSFLIDEYLKKIVF